MHSEFPRVIKHVCSAILTLIPNCLHVGAYHIESYYLEMFNIFLLYF